MPWTTPVNPVPGSVITAAFAIANWLDPIRWLRIMTGNADPPGTNYVVTSDSTSGTSWKTGPAAIATVLGYTPANLGGDTFTGAVAVGSPFTVAKTDDAGNGGHLILQPSAGQNGAHMDATNSVFRLYGTATPATAWQINLGSGTMTLPVLSSITTGSLQAAAPSAAAGYAIDADSNQFRVFNPANAARMLQFGLTTGALRLPAIDSVTTGSIQGATPSGAAGYVIDAFGNQFRVYNAANATFMLAFGLTTNVLTVGGNAVITSATIGAQTVANATQVGGRTPSTTPTASGIPVADGAGKLAAGWLPAGGVDAASVTGHVPTTTPAAGALPLADASGKLDDWVTATSLGAFVPDGLIALWDGTPTTAPPSGWTFITSFNGRFVIAAQAGVFPLGTTGGSPNLPHTHSTNIAHGHNHTITAGGIVQANTAATGEMNAATPGITAATVGHAHGFTPSTSGTVTALANPTNVTSGDATPHMPPYIALNYIRKG